MNCNCACVQPREIHPTMWCMNSLKWYECRSQSVRFQSVFCFREMKGQSFKLSFLRERSHSPRQRTKRRVAVQEYQFHHKAKKSLKKHIGRKETGLASFATRGSKPIHKQNMIDNAEQTKHKKQILKFKIKFWIFKI